MPFPSRVIPARRTCRLLALLTAACGLVVACATPAEPGDRRTPARAAMTPVTTTAAASTWPPTTGPTPTYDFRTYPRFHGTGWKALTSHGITSIHSQPYVIVFADSAARSRLTPYLTGPAAQITATTGVQVTVSTTLDTTPVGTCPAWRRIVVHYSYRPTGTAGMSTADPCVSTADQSAWGGHLRINSEYWAAGWYSSDPAQQEIMRKNVITHELIPIPNFPQSYSSPQLVHGVNQLGNVGSERGRDVAALRRVSELWGMIGPCCKRETSTVVR
ncbi:hypothetical protein ACWGH4_00570 [Streptomyces sp. NPDC054847]